MKKAEFQKMMVNKSCTQVEYISTEDEVCCDLWKCGYCDSQFYYPNLPMFCPICGKRLQNTFKENLTLFAGRLRTLGRTGIGPNCSGCKKIPPDGKGQRDICEKCMHETLAQAAEVIDMLNDMITAP